MNQTKILIDENQVYSQINPQKYGFQTRPQQKQYSPIIKGYFPKESSVKEMAIKKLNTTLTLILGVFILMTLVSYYFATADEIVLNDLSRQTTLLNDENSDLQNRLDKLKSFNNVDFTMQKYNFLQKAKQVMEVPAVVAPITSEKKNLAQKPFAWSIGY